LMEGNKIFVLVHGAFHGGWCWKRILPILRGAGYEVHTPTLTGQGDRIHLVNPDINLDTHIQDIVNLLEFEDLHNVILVGHSYGGMVITGVEAKVPQRLSHLVFFDSFLPEDGKSLNDYAPWLMPFEAQSAENGNRLVLNWFSSIEKLCHVTDPTDLAWMIPRISDQPFKTFSQPVVCKPNPSVKRVFIHTSDLPIVLDSVAKAKTQGIHVHELLNAGHDAMVLKPTEFAKILLEIAK